jgi:hypothetical protein
MLHSATHVCGSPPCRPLQAHATVLHSTTCRSTRSATPPLGSTAPLRRPGRTPWPLAASSQGDVAQTGPLLSVNQVTAAAAARGLALRLTTLGPLFTVAATVDDVDDTPLEVGLLQGFLLPPPLGGLLHLDSVRVFNSRLRGTLRGKAQSPFGIAVLLGAAAFAHAAAAGCTRAELLAIDDGNGYAQRLVTYYRRLGFVVVRTVGDGGWRDVPDLLVWGGVGTRMDADIATMLTRWSGAVSRGAGGLE